MASFVYNTAKRKLLDGTLDLTNDVIRAMLVTSGYTANADHDFVSDLTPGSNELSGTGYARITLSSKAFSTDDANDRGEFDAADLTWNAINAGTAAALIIYKQTGGSDATPADDDLIAHIDTGGFPITTNGGDLTIQVNAEGLIHLT